MHRSCDILRLGNSQMNGYVCFYNGKRIEVRAETSYKAQLEAARVLKVPAKRQYQISVTFCERADGSQVTHNAAGL